MHHSCCTRHHRAATAPTSAYPPAFRPLRRATPEKRPHRAIGRRTPAQAFAARIKATPRRPGITIPAQHRVRRDRIDSSGVVTLRYQSRLRHLGVGRRHAGTRVMLLVADRDVRVITQDGELLAEFTINPNKDYQPKKGPGQRPTLSGMS